jgi:hypothetical protein
MGLELWEMGMITTRDKALMLTGISTLRAWDAGALPYFIQRFGMNLSDAMRFGGENGFMIRRVIKRNIIVTTGLQLVLDVLNDDEATGLTYHAIGDTASPSPVIGNTTLNNEVERKAFASRSRAGAQATLSVFYLSTESNYSIAEVGVFGGASASATPDSGIMFSHALQAYDNSGGSPNDLTFDYVLSVEEV